MRRTSSLLFIPFILYPLSSLLSPLSSPLLSSPPPFLLLSLKSKKHFLHPLFSAYATASLFVLHLNRRLASSLILNYS